MPSHRFWKKTVYAAGFFVVCVGFLLVVIPLSFRSRTTPTPTPTQSPFSPIVLEQRAALVHQRVDGSRSLDLVAQLRNPNPRAGVSGYPVTFVAYGKDDAELVRKKEMVHLTPGALQYAAAIDIPIANDATVSRVDVLLPAHDDVQFVLLPEGVSVPEFQTFVQARSVRDVGGNAIETQPGLVRNTGTFDWQKVEVMVVGLNQSKNIIAVGKTFIGRLLVGEQRQFTVQWPATSEPIVDVVALPSTDMFGEANVVEILGNSGLLQ